MKSKFIPPTLAEVEAYCKDKDLRYVNPAEFFEYFSKADWIDSKNNPVLNWKNKAVTWNMAKRKSKQMHNEYIARTKIIENEKKIHNKPLTNGILSGIVNTLFDIPKEVVKPVREYTKALLKQTERIELTPEQKVALSVRSQQALQIMKQELK